jgi:tRNA G10  N-methylase Trm11
MATQNFLNLQQTSFLNPDIEVNNDNLQFDPKTVVSNIGKREWIFPPYSIQSWGSWLHRIAPYVGRIKPSFAHFLIKYASKPGDLILDPFCGIGTIPTEASLMGRNAIGIDLNPYAYYISLAKTDNKRNLDELIEYVNKVKIDTSKIDLSTIPAWVKEYYNHETLREILFLIEKLKKDKQYFILGCLIGISQGHRPGHLSKPVAWTLPYKPRPDDKGEYRETKSRLIQKLIRTYKNNFSDIGELKAYLEDARKLPIESNSVDHIISSPPYYDTLDYVGSHRLRLAISGYHDEVQKKKLRSELIQQHDTYLEEMMKTIIEMNRVLKKDGYCILIVGDCVKGKKLINTADELTPLLESAGFKCHGVIRDEIPINKSVQKKSEWQKHDRIMILTKN